MKRRNFLTAISSFLLAPLALLRRRSSAEAAPAILNCPATTDPRGEPGPSGHTPAIPYKYIPVTSATEKEFYNIQLCVPYTPLLSHQLVRVDHSPLRLLGEGPGSSVGFSRAPWVVLEHNAEKDGDGPGRLLVDQLVPCRQRAYERLPNKQWKVTDEPCEPQMSRIMELWLKDPYQLLLADLLVRGLVEKGVIQNEGFIQAWNQTVIDSQQYQYDNREDSGDVTPVKFYDASCTASDLKVGPVERNSRRLHATPSDSTAQVLSEYHAAIDELDEHKRTKRGSCRGFVLDVRQSSAEA